MNLGKLLIGAGMVLLALGAITIVLSRFDVPLGRLPGDITWRGKNNTVYFPWVTCLVLSVLGSVLLWFFNRR